MWYIIGVIVVLVIVLVILVGRKKSKTEAPTGPTDIAGETLPEQPLESTSSEPTIPEKPEEIPARRTCVN
jgi:hypothetical protein